MTPWARLPSETGNVGLIPHIRWKCFCPSFAWNNDQTQYHGNCQYGKHLGSILYAQRWEFRWEYYVFFQCSWPTPFLLCYPFLGWFFLTELPFCTHILLRLMYLWVWCLMLTLMLRFVLLLIFPEALCDSILECTILVGQLNKLFGLITQTIKSLHGLYCMVFKYMFFWCDT